MYNGSRPDRPPELIPRLSIEKAEAGCYSYVVSVGATICKAMPEPLASPSSSTGWR